MISAIRAGAPLKDAAAVAGISTRAFEAWRKRGRDELEAREDGFDPDHDEDAYVRLVQAVDLAQAQSRVRGVANIQRVAAGGIVTEETTRRYRDETGNMIEETTIKRSAPDWRATAFLLERTHRAEFGKTSAVELTGADGGPLQVAHSVDLSSAAANIKASLALSAGSVVPGEIVARPEQ
jgi:hypothetical protein